MKSSKSVPLSEDCLLSTKTLLLSASIWSSGATLASFGGAWTSIRTPTVNDGTTIVRYRDGIVTYLTGSLLPVFNHTDYPGDICHWIDNNYRLPRASEFGSSENPDPTDWLVSGCRQEFGEPWSVGTQSLYGSNSPYYPTHGTVAGHLR